MIIAIRIFLQAAGRRKWLVLLCLVCAGLAEGVGIASLLPLIAVLADDASGGGSTLARVVTETLASVGLDASVGTLLVIIVAGITLKSILNIMAMRFVGDAVTDVATHFRLTLLRNLLRSEWSYFIKYPIGVLGGLVGGQAMQAATAFQQAALLLANLVQCAIYLGVAALVSWKLVAAALVTGAVLVLALRRFVRRTRQAGFKQTKVTHELGALLNDTLLGIKSLKAMARDEAFERLLRDKVHKIKKTMRVMTGSKEMLTNLQEPVVISVMAIGFYVLIVMAKLPIGEVLVMGLLLQRSVRGINKVQQQIQMFAQMEGAFAHLTFMVGETDRHRERHPGGRTPTLEHGIRLERVGFAYGEMSVLADLSLEIPARTLTVLTGPSGVGKTTLTDLLLGFYRPQAGRILVDGVPLDEIDMRAWRSLIGYVPQDPTLFRDTVLANVTLKGAGESEADAIEALEAADAWGFVAALPHGLHTEVGERGSKLSGGQRQRISIARALVHRPRLLILDEVTSALDHATEQAICRNIAALARRMTVIAISHRPAWFEVTDRVYRLEAGGVVAAGATSRAAASAGAACAGVA
jgi:ATP-binding cassette subfamily C protein